jgi:tetratricopeptide (TPR) repeat protein
MIPLRLARELTYQLDHAAEHERLARALAVPGVFITLWVQSESDILTLWNSLARKGFVPENYLSMNLVQREATPSGKKLTLVSDFIHCAASLFYHRGNYERSLEFSDALASHAKAIGDKRKLCSAVAILGNINIAQSRYDEAIRCYERQRELAGELSDGRSLAVAIGHIGTVYGEQGQHEKAGQHFKQQFELAETLGDKSGMSVALGHMGLTFSFQNSQDEAGQCFRLSLALAEELGNKRQVSLTIGNMGNVHWYRAEYEEAARCYKHWSEIADELGDKRMMAHAFGNLASVCTIQGRYRIAIRYYDRQRELAQELANKHLIYHVFGNMGYIHRELGHVEDAMTYSKRAIEGHRAIELKSPIPTWLGNISSILLESSGNINEARKNAAECLDLSEEFKLLDNIYLSQVLLARCDAADGENDLAIKKLQAMLSGTKDEEQIADLHYWLWKIASENNHKAEALSRYESLWTRIPKFEFAKRIAELREEPIPREVDENGNFVFA